MNRREFAALSLGAAFSLAFAGCTPTPKAPEEHVETEEEIRKRTFKVGLICEGSEQTTYNKNFISAFRDAMQTLNVPQENYFIKTDIAPNEQCYNAAAELVSQGCGFVISTSLGHEDLLLQAAQNFPNVQFCAATGTKALRANLGNFHNAYAAIHQGHYLAGAAAGMKLAEAMDQGSYKANNARIGYVTAFDIAETISGYTAFYLGAKSIVPDVMMDVVYTESWYDEAEAYAAAKKLIDRGCQIIAQHLANIGASSACEEAGIPDIPYDSMAYESFPKTYLISPRIDWCPYFEYAVGNLREGKEISIDWAGSVATGSVALVKLNEELAAPGTSSKLISLMEEFKKGEGPHVFDVKSFTVKSKHIDSYKVNLKDEEAEPSTEAIFDGYFHESEFRSAPYFDMQIDGITLLS